MFGYVRISGRISRVSLGQPFRHCNGSCSKKVGLFEIISRPNKNFSTMPVLLKSKNLHRLSILTGLSGGQYRSSMPRYLSVFVRPLHQSFFLQSWILNSSLSFFEQRRCKTSNKSPKRPEHDSDSDSDNDDDDEPIQGTKVLTVCLQSLRTDGILKKALGVARNKVETAFYEGNIRVNGEKPLKKSHQLKIGDEVDLIRGVSPVNPDLLSISRVEILSVKEDDEDQLSIKIRRTKTLYIENYNTNA